MDVAGIVLSFVSVMISAGALVYAIRSGRALEAESKRLRSHTSMLLRALDTAGVISVRYENGEPAGVSHHAEAHLRLRKGDPEDGH